jgi:predicted Zn-dependent protease
MTEPTPSSGISPAKAVAHAMKLLASDPILAERQAREILKVLPHDSRATFIVGAARRRAGDASAARAILEPLVQAQPNSAYAQHELGLALAALGERAAAVEALRRAAALKRDMPSTWLALSDQLTLAGDADGAAAAHAEHVRASVKEPSLRKAADALGERRFADAEKILRGHLKAFPTDVAAMRMLGETAARLGHAADAEELLVRCLELAPGFVGARFNYALVLLEHNKTAEAIEELERLLAAAPNEHKYLTVLAACYGFDGDYHRSLEILERILAADPQQPRVWLNYGQTLRIIGQLDKAIEAVKRSIALNPKFGEPYWCLADLKTVRFSDAEVASMRAQLADAALGASDRLHLHYALGKALEDASQWQASFAHYAQGAKLRREQLPHDADANSAWVERCKAHFTKEFFASRAQGGCLDAAPIFIVGLPRSGSTLIEQILGSHSQVEATMELPELIHISARLERAGRKSAGADYPELTAQLSAEDRAALGEEFIRRTRRYRKLGRAFFVDKMPSNFYHIGLIRLILPRAKIIDVRRHPMAACFAAFKQHFFRAQNFSYDLQDLGRYYRDYVALMAHFDAALPGQIHRVIYEDVVENMEGEVRRLLDFCALPFEAGCVRFWEGGRAVPTHSSEQVRRPIFRESLEQWRNYEPWLGALRGALGPALQTWRELTPTSAPSLPPRNRKPKKTTKRSAKKINTKFMSSRRQSSR